MPLDTTLIDLINEKIPPSTPDESYEVSADDINEVFTAVATEIAAVEDADIAHRIPAGGTTGQILAKASNSDYDLVWVDAVSNPTLAAPANFAGTTADGHSVLTWDASPNATGYIVKKNGTTIYTGALLTFDATGLTNGVAYTFTVVATATGYNNSPASSVTVTPAASSVDTRPRFGTGPATFTGGALASLLGTMSPLTGSSNDGHSGTFNITTTSGNYGWVAVESSASTSGVRFFDGVGFAGWSGAGLSGNNTGASDDPSTSTVTYNDGVTDWRFFRQDYINANPTSAGYTLS